MAHDKVQTQCENKKKVTPSEKSKESSQIVQDKQSNKHSKKHCSNFKSHSTFKKESCKDPHVNSDHHHPCKNSDQLFNSPLFGNDDKENLKRQDVTYKILF